MTDHQALIEILEYLHVSNPCCSCCDSDGAYAEAQLFAANVGESVGLHKIEVKHFQCHAKFNPHPAFQANCPDCKRWSTYIFRD